MKKTLKIVLVVAILLFVAKFAFAAGKDVWQDPNTRYSNFSKAIGWGRCNCLVILKNGRLDIDIGRTGKKLLIDNGVNFFSATGTGIGPIVVYKTGNALRYFHRNKINAKEKRKTFHKGDLKRVCITGHRNGAYIKLVTSNNFMYKYWIDDRGPFLKGKYKIK